MFGRMSELPDSLSQTRNRRRATATPSRFLVSAIVAIAFLLIAPSRILAQLPTARLNSIFPPGGKAGSSFEVTVAGQDLDDAVDLHFSNPSVTAKPKMNEKSGQPETGVFLVKIDSAASVGVCEARVAGRFGVSNPRAFVIGDLPESIGPSTNTTAGSAVMIKT